MDTDKILDIINSLAPLIYIIVPAIWAVVLQTKKKISIKTEEIIRKDKQKAQEKYDMWEHEESKTVIKRIKDQCNLHKDRGYADLVHYMQLENGTMATSKIQNMFMTCLAEDDRYGMLPKQITKLQRIPYSECAEWVTQVTSNPDIHEQILLTPTMVNAKYNEEFVLGDKRIICSSIAAPIYDPNEILVGVVAFYYHTENFAGKEEEEVKEIKTFRTAIESILYEYHIRRTAKKKELGLED